MHAAVKIVKAYTAKFVELEIPKVIKSILNNHNDLSSTKKFIAFVNLLKSYIYLNMYGYHFFAFFYATTGF
jgi:hypothetical protein